MTAVAADRLRPTFRGTLLEPGQPGYDDARKVHNGLVDKRPALIAQCRNVEDIAAAVKFARAQQLEISVRGGGHNVAGRAVSHGGLMIDLSSMNRVTVDAAKRTAVAEGGATWGTFNAETMKHGLATTGGVISSTGVAGLTLGGGLGWLMALHGMAVDNLDAAQIVTADGTVVTCNANNNADLFWAIRGGGGNFGVAATLTFRLHPVSEMVVGGLAAHPLDKAPAMLRFFRDTNASAPDELSVFGGLLHAPDGSGHKIGAMVVFHPDPVAGMKAVQPVKAYGPPVIDMIGPMPYVAVNSMLDGGFPKGALNYWKSSFLTSLPDKAIDTIVAAFAECPAPMGAMLLEHFHGAVTRVPVADTAFPHRTAGYNLLIIAEWMDPSHGDASIAWARKTYEAMRPYMAPGRYVNYLGDDEAPESVAAAYGSTYARLRRVKKQYDPENVFHLNQNITPG
jgi:FAD/FMN-containing dehydrogenase